MENRNYKSGDEIEILSLFEKAFSRQLPMSFWKWRFADNPFLKAPMINIMWEDNLMIGHYAVSAIEMNIDNKTYLSSLSGTTMTHPDFAGKGIFSQLALSLYDRIAKDYGISMVLGFPNRNSHYGLVKKIHWNDVSIISNLSCSVIKTVDSNLDGIRKIELFDAAHEAYIKSEIQRLGFSVSVNRSANYLNWRYINCPVNQYDCFEYVKDNKLIGVFITKSFQSFDDTGSFEIDIIDLICAPQLEIVGSIISHINAYYAEKIRKFSKINLWMSLFDPRHLMLERLGFSNGLPLTFMSTKPFISGIEQIDDARNWYIAMGDSDVF